MWKQFATQFGQVWQRATPLGRALGITSLVVTLVTIVGVGIWSSRPDYVPLREGIAPTLTAEIVSRLESSGIPYKLNYSGTGVLVPKHRWNDANVLIADLEGAPGSGSSTDGGVIPHVFGEDPVARRKEKEKALELAIGSLRAVRSAKVQLAIPDPSPFRAQRQTPSASVMVQVVPGHVMTKELGASIIALVASGVEGMKTANVTVTDDSGNLYSGESIAANSPAVGRFEYVRVLEASLVAKAEEVLRAKLGPNNATVRVTAEVDFTDSVQRSTTIDSEVKAKKREKLETTKTQGMPISAVGPAGTGSNGGGSTPTQAAVPMEGNTESIENDYLFPETEETVTKHGGTVKRLTVSAIVDLDSTDPAADPAADPASAGGAAVKLSQQQVENLIRNAVGFDATRGDVIEVVLTDLPQPDPAAAAAVPDTKKWEFFSELAKNASLGLAAIVALIIGMLTLKKVRPITVPGGNAEDDEDRRNRLLTELSSRVQENPEAVSRILAAWLGDTPNRAETPDERPDTIPMKRAG